MWISEHDEIEIAEEKWVDKEILSVKLLSASLHEKCMQYSALQFALKVCKQVLQNTCRYNLHLFICQI